MLALYLAALCFGGIPILVSLVLGGADKDFDKNVDAGHGDADHDHDHDGDADHDAADHDHDADGDAEADVDGDAEADGDHEAQKDVHHGGSDFSLWWLLSMRFWTFGLMAFGLAGTLMTLFGVPALITALAAAALGGGSGFAAAQLFRALSRDQVSGETELGRYVGEEAKVLLPVRPGQQGKIVVSTLAGRVELLATTRDATALEVGSRVIVADIRQGVADVSGLSAVDDDARAVRARAGQRRERDRA